MVNAESTGPSKGARVLLGIFWTAVILLAVLMSREWRQWFGYDLSPAVPFTLGLVVGLVPYKYRVGRNRLLLIDQNRRQEMLLTLGTLGMVLLFLLLIAGMARDTSTSTGQGFSLIAGILLGSALQLAWTDKR